jgi:hypothetical protein
MKGLLSGAGRIMNGKRGLRAFRSAYEAAYQSLQDENRRTIYAACYEGALPMVNAEGGGADDRSVWSGRHFCERPESVPPARPVPTSLNNTAQSETHRTAALDAEVGQARTLTDWRFRETSPRQLILQ